MMTTGGARGAEPPRTEPALIPVIRSLTAPTPTPGLIALDEHQTQWALSLGLSGALSQVARGDPGLFPADLLRQVVFAELAAKRRCALQESALCELLDALPGASGRITLVKGVSVRRRYPQPHWRTMADLDLLVETDDLADVEAALGELGYERCRRMPTGYYAQHHHTRPFEHPKTAVRMELHTWLFHPAWGLTGPGAVFGAEILRAQSRPSGYLGRPVRRLSRELELAVCATHWAYGLRLPHVVKGMLDTLFLLADPRQEPDWRLLSSWMGARRVGTALAVLLSYLRKYRVLDVNRQMEGALERAGNSVGGIALGSLHRILDRCMSGRFPGPLLTQSTATTTWQTFVMPRSAAFRLAFLPARIGYRSTIGRSGSLPSATARRRSNDPPTRTRPESGEA